MSSNTFHNTGDFRGAQVIQGSNIQNLSFTVSNNFSDQTANVEALQEQLNSLAEALKSLPPEKSEEAEAIAETAQEYIAEADSEKPDGSKLKTLGRNLTVMAKATFEYAPKVLDVATKIVAFVAKINGPE